MLYFATEEKSLSSAAGPYGKSKLKLNTEWSEVEISFHYQNISKHVVYKYKLFGDLDSKGFNFGHFGSKNRLQ
jgi:hypothetical protein